jgi:cytochrome c peroxidase
MKKSAWIFCCLAVMGFSVSTFKSWPPKHYTFLNGKADSNKIWLGRVLFYDPILSRDSSISCENCHSPYTAFTHTDHALSHGIEDRIGKRNAPALFNLAWHNELMWDGAVNHLEVQALAPITNADEMDESLPRLMLKLNRSAKYRSLFSRAFGDTVINTPRMLTAIAQFLLTLESRNSGYDSMKMGLKQFTQQEKRGYALFKKHCNSCHREPLFSHFGFERNGLPPNVRLADSGRMKITGSIKDLYRFKVPTLRNIELTYPYMHDGRFKNLSEVIRHYSDDIKIGTATEPLAGPLHLTSEQKTDLMAFLLTLTDRSFILNNNHHFPKP